MRAAMVEVGERVGAMNRAPTISAPTNFSLERT
jgi:hypothetical protein